jgi:hypothetical protein
MMVLSSTKPVRVKCPLGGYAPCVDDLCYGGGQMVCGLEMDFDVCFHGFIPETCNQGCSTDDSDDYYPWPEDV